MALRLLSIDDIPSNLENRSVFDKNDKTDNRREHIFVSLSILPLLKDLALPSVPGVSEHQRIPHVDSEVISDCDE